jgi:hypothetical protein
MSRSEKFLEQVDKINEGNLLLVTERGFLTDAHWEEFDGTKVALTLGLDDSPSIVLSVLDKNGQQQVYEYTPQTKENATFEVSRKFNDIVEIAKTKGVSGIDLAEWTGV